MQVKNTDVGFIGLGVMGKSIAENLRTAGARLHIFTRTKNSANELIQKGEIWYDSPKELAPNCKLIFTIVGYPKDVEQLYLGETGLLQSATAETIFVDMTTSSPILAKQIYKKALEKKCYALDAPVSGGDIGAKNATLSIMVGGDAKAFEEVVPFFNCISKLCVLQGNAGAGQHTKMANQIAVAANLFGAVEAIRYAESAGLDAKNTLKTITNGAATSWQLMNNGTKMLEQNYEPGFYAKHFLKDLNIALSSAKAFNLNLPLLELAQSFFDKMNQAGYSEKGTQALYDYYKNFQIV